MLPVAFFHILTVIEVISAIMNKIFLYWFLLSLLFMWLLWVFGVDCFIRGFLETAEEAQLLKRSKTRCCVILVDFGRFQVAFSIILSRFTTNVGKGCINFGM